MIIRESPGLRRVDVEDEFANSKTVQTGLDDLPMVCWEDGLMPNFPNGNLRDTLATIQAEGKTASDDESLPEHVRGLAFWASVTAEDLNARLKDGRATTEGSAREGLEIGMWYCRFKLWSHEEPALTGKKIISTNRRKGRKPPVGSVRDLLSKIVGGWQMMSNGRLLMYLKPLLPDMDQDNILRQLKRLRKSGL